MNLRNVMTLVGDGFAAVLRVFTRRKAKTWIRPSAPPTTQRIEWQDSVDNQPTLVVTHINGTKRRIPARCVLCSKLFVEGERISIHDRLGAAHQRCISERNR